VTDQTKLALLADSPVSDTVRTGGAARAYARGGMVVDRAHDDPYLAGMSVNHRTLYIDRHVPRTLTVKGKTFDPAPFLMVHEQHERYHMDRGMKYKPAHRLALKAEQKAVVAAGIDWNGYQEIMHRLATITQRESTTLSHPPRDLYKGPFSNRQQKELTKKGDFAPDTKRFAEGGEVGGEPWKYEYETGEEGETPTSEKGKPWEYDYAEPTKYSGPEEAAKRTAQAVAPGLGGLAAGGAGFRGGLAAAPLLAPIPVAGPALAAAAPFVGGIGGAVLGSMGIHEIQQWFMDKLGIKPDEEKAQAFQQEHPHMAAGADIAGGLAGGAPGIGVSLGTRALMGGVQGGLEVAGNVVRGEDIDPTNVALATAAGAALPGLNRLGKPLWEAGEKAAQRYLPGGKPQTGRPDQRALPAPPDFTTSSEGETARYPGGDDQVFGRAAAPRPGTAQENERPIYEMPRDQYSDITRPRPNVGPASENVAGQTRPGTAPPENVAMSAERPTPEKTTETIAQHKTEAAPARNMGSTLGTAHEQPPPEKGVGTVGSDPDNPMSVGSTRDYRKTADSNVHPTSSGAGNPPTATIGEPARGNISPEIEQALVAQVKTAMKKGRSNDYLAKIYDKAGLGPEQARDIRQQAEHQLTGQEQPRRPLDQEQVETQPQTQTRIPEENTPSRVEPEFTGPLLREVPNFPKTQEAYQQGHRDYIAGRMNRKYASEDEGASYDRGGNDAMTAAREEYNAKHKTGIPEAAVTNTVTKLRDVGLEQLADHVEKNPDLAPKAREVMENPEGLRMMEAARLKRKEEAAALVEKGKAKRAEEKKYVPLVDREEVGAENTQRRENEGQVANLGEGEETVTASSQTKTARLERAATSAQSAFDKFPPNGAPHTAEKGYQPLADRLRAALAHAKEENFGLYPFLTPGSKRAFTKTNAEVTSTPLEGKGFAAAAPGKALKKRTAAQEWLKQAYDLVGSQENPKIILPSTALEFLGNERMARSGAKGKELREFNKVETDVAMKKKGWDDLIDAQKEEFTKEPIDEQHVEELRDYAQLSHNMETLDHEHWLDEKIAAVKVPTSEREAAPTKNPVTHENEVGFHNKFEQEAVERATAAVKSKYATFTLKKNPAEPASLSELIKRIGADEKGDLDYKKVQEQLMIWAKPIKNFVVRNIMPEMFSERSRAADPKFAGTQVKRARAVEQLSHLLDAEHRRVSKLSEYDQISMLTRFEEGTPQDAPWKQELADRVSGMLENAYRSELIWGSKAEFIDNYLSHMFEKEEDFIKFKEDQKQRYGPTWFQRERGFLFIKDALAAGYKLKYTNMAEIATRRLMASADMQFKMQLLHEMRTMELAYPKADKSKAVTGQWQEIGAPNRDTWMLAPDIQALWKNGIDAKGLWANENMIGSIFRGWMTMKNIMVPIKLMLSAFHPLHIALGVLQADNFARGWKFTEGNMAQKLTGGAKEMFQNITDPLFAWGDALTPNKNWFNPEFIGKQYRRALDTPWGEKTPQQELWTQYANEAGYKGNMSHEEVNSSNRAFHDAWDKFQQTKAIPDAARIVFPAFRVAVEKSMKPLFMNWIPNLKDASFARSVAAYLKLHPEMIQDANSEARGIALRDIAKSVDNRYGEMFYGGVFWNRYVKDMSIGSFLSLGWNLGFAREFGGGIYQAGRSAASNIPQVGPRTGASAIVHDASSKAAYVASYTAITGLMAGAMTYALSGQAPSTPMDYFFPRAGGLNPDGSPRRLSTMFFTREPVQARAHIQQEASVSGGLGQMLYNKMMFGPVVQAYQNRDFFGRQLYDPEAPWYQRWGQFGKSVLGDALNPIALSSMERAQQTGGGARDKALAVAGFGPAPGYVSKDAFQNRIQHLFFEGPGAGAKPYANKERDQQRRNDFATIRTGGPDASAARQRLIKSGIAPQTLTRELHETTDRYQFSRLDRAVQKALIPQMSDAQFLKYRPVSPKARLELDQEWKRLHPGKDLPRR
jgi:hypothetical protein